MSAEDLERLLDGVKVASREEQEGKRKGERGGEVERNVLMAGFGKGGGC